MTFAREVLDSERFQSVVDSLKEAIDDNGALKVDEWREEDTRVLYELGYNLYRTKDFPSAETVFRKLVVVMPLEKSHWQGLASSIQMQHRFEDALVPWSMFAFIDPKSPIPHFYAAECLFALKNYSACLEAIAALASRDAKGEYTDRVATMKATSLQKMEGDYV